MNNNDRGVMNGGVSCVNITEYLCWLRLSRQFYAMTGVMVSLVNQVWIRDDAIQSNMADECLPYYEKGVVVQGFGRGSKKLGIPTGEREIIPSG